MPRGGTRLSDRAGRDKKGTNYACALLHPPLGPTVTQAGSSPEAINCCLITFGPVNFCPLQPRIWRQHP